MKWYKKYSAVSTQKTTFFSYWKPGPKFVDSIRLIIIHFPTKEKKENVFIYIDLLGTVDMHNYAVGEEAHGAKENHTDQGANQTVTN